MNEGWKHLYGVIDGSGEFNFPSGCAQNEAPALYPVAYGGFSAIVSDNPSDYKTMTKDQLLRHLLDHQRVIESVMESHSIIPFKFGSLAQNDDEIAQILDRGNALFKSLLPWVRERVEFELAATWNKEAVFKSIYQDEPEIRSLQEKIEHKGGENVLPEKINLGRLVQQSLVKRNVEVKDKILFQLNPCAESQCDHDALGDLMILNTAFLLRKGTEDEFDSKVRSLDEVFLGKLSFKLIGPLPLYSFKCIEIEWIDADRFQHALSVLGLERDASMIDLRKAYYQRAKLLHPDSPGKGLNSPSEFEKLAEAYRLLKNVHSLYLCFDVEDRTPLIMVRGKES